MAEKTAKIYDNIPDATTVVIVAEKPGIKIHLS
jgi:hypothetical protein